VRTGGHGTMTRIALGYLLATLLVMSFLATIFVGLMLAFVIPLEEHVLWGLGP
jgi:hypothetical protein